MSNEVDLWVAWSIKGRYMVALYGTANKQKEMRACLKNAKKNGDNVEGIEPRMITVWLTSNDGSGESNG